MIDYKKCKKNRIRSQMYCDKVRRENRISRLKCQRKTCFTCIGKNKEIYLKIMEKEIPENFRFECKRAFPILKKVKGEEQVNCRGILCGACRKIMYDEVQLDFKVIFNSLRAPKKKKKVTNDIQ